MTRRPTVLSGLVQSTQSVQRTEFKPSPLHPKYFSIHGGPGNGSGLVTCTLLGLAPTIGVRKSKDEPPNLHPQAPAPETEDHPQMQPSTPLMGLNVDRDKPFRPPLVRGRQGSEELLWAPQPMPQPTPRPPQEAKATIPRDQSQGF